MAYPEHWMNELLGKNDIVTVVSSYTELKPKGRRLWGLCPVHGEKTASFSVSPDKQLYYCFGCHIGGSVIQFIMDVEHMTFHEAVEHLANRAGLAMPQEVNDAAMMQERAKRDSAEKCHGLAPRHAPWCHPRRAICHARPPCPRHLVCPGAEPMCLPAGEGAVFLAHYRTRRHMALAPIGRGRPARVKRHAAAPPASRPGHHPRCPPQLWRSLHN